MKPKKVIIPDDLNSKDYKKPELVDLNEIRETLAVCEAGSGDGTYCAAGNSASVGYCTAGFSPGTACTNVGTFASTACTAGTTF